MEKKDLYLSDERVKEIARTFSDNYDLYHSPENAVERAEYAVSEISKASADYALRKVVEYLESNTDRAFGIPYISYKVMHTLKKLALDK